jgi:putative flippase GtrA
LHGVVAKFARYFATGGSAAIVDAGGFDLLQKLGLATLPAAVVSYAVATIVNFQFTARFVFAQKATARGYLTFLSAALVGMIVNVGVTLFTARLLGCPPVVAKIIGIGTAFSINFMLNVFVVFRDNESKSSIPSSALSQNPGRETGTPPDPKIAGCCSVTCEVVPKNADSCTRTSCAE